MSFTISVNEHITLKLRTEADAEEMFLLTDKNRELLRLWLPWVDKTLSVEDTERYIQETKEKFDAKKSADFGILYDNVMAGSMGFNKIDWVNENAEIGYWLGEEFQGKGIMTECVRAMVNYGFNELNLHRIEIRCSTINTKSANVPKRLGFKHEGRLIDDHKRNGEFSDTFIFGITRNTWNG